MSATTGTMDLAGERLEFEGLTIEWDPRVLRPRTWTAEQGRWAAELAAGTPPGPILELCCGAGQIGLVAARDSGRSLVQVDRDPVAAAYARRNAAAAGVTTEVRCGPIGEVLDPEERYGVVVADPPWLRTSEVDEFPEDPLGAVDGGRDGMELVRACIEVGIAHLAPGGHLVLQIGDAEQLAEVTAHVDRHAPDHTVRGVRVCQPGGIVVNIGSKDNGSKDNGSKDAEEPRDTEESTGEPGQVSEVGSLDDTGPITPGDSVAGHPKDDDVQEGATGPEVPTGNQDQEGDPQ